MTKSKIAISIDKELLRSIDSKIDSAFLHSRSQAIEFFLKKGLNEETITTAVLLLKGPHFELLLKPYKSKLLLSHQLEFLQDNNVKKVYILTQTNPHIAQVQKEIDRYKIDVSIVVGSAKGNAEALYSIRDKLSGLSGRFIVMSGDILNKFDLHKMIRKHLSSDKIGSIGLMSANKPQKYGAVVLDGDLVTEFVEKPKNSFSNIVNSGVYIFSENVFELFSGQTVSLEQEILPKLAKLRQLSSYFTMGEYMHFG